ncbi:MAG: hypothetical protein APF76_06360 [Desulfitibacter sp. BRH_c19]|nr:MAG: hypothetical protein APF76_06360 [Desulfitibacter sp. BRH_c19]
MSETKMNIDMLIMNGLVVPVTGPNQVIENGAVAVNKGRILEVGTTDTLIDKYNGRKIINARNKAVMPGLINAHCHFLQDFLKGARDDLPLIDWIDQVSFPRIRVAVQDYLNGRNELQNFATLHGCITNIKSGITSVVNMEWATPVDTIKVYEDIGIRAAHTLTITDNHKWTPSAAILSNDILFNLADELNERCKGSKDNRVSFWYGLACPNSCTPGMLTKVRELADMKHIPIHIHLAETEYEYNSFKKNYNKTPTEFLKDLGVLGNDVLAAHCIWVTDEDIKILKETGTSVVHNPECNMKIGSGIAPIAKILKEGINVSLGTDSCAVNDNTDIFQTMRIAVMLQRVANLDSMIVSSYQALEMATIGGAKSLGLGDQLGTLESGKLADIILVDLKSANMRPINNIINNLVYCAQSGNVDTVIVNGNIVMDNKIMLTVNEEEALYEAEAYALGRFKEAGLSVPSYYLTSIKEGKE